MTVERRFARPGSSTCCLSATADARAPPLLPRDGPERSTHVRMPPHHISLYVSPQAGNVGNDGIPAGDTERRSKMSDASTRHHDEADRYEIRLQGHLDSRW